MLQNRLAGNKLSICLILGVVCCLAFSFPLLAADGDGVETLRGIGQTFSKIAADASPAVVGIKVEKMVDVPQGQFPFGSPFGDDDFFKFFFGPEQRQSPRQRQQAPKQKERAQGSGFIITADGYILTNNHLVGGADKVMVKVNDDQEVEAKVIGTDPDSDVAVVKIDVDKDLSFLEMGDSDKIVVGQWVLAIGNPFGLSHTVTAGIVSARGRSGVGLATYEDFIQTDAAINPGNSGGPLIDLDGKVIGINTAIVGSSGNIGIGLAIPINMAKSVYEQIVDTGKVVRGYLGVLPQDLTPELAQSFGLEKANGVLIAEVVKDSAADKAGLKQGDIVTQIDGKKIDSADLFRNEVAMIKPDTEIKLTVLRDGKSQIIEVKLEERTKEATLKSEGRSEVTEKIGITVQNLTDDLAQRFGYEDMSGVIVTKVDQDSLAHDAGIQEGMLIQEVNRQKINNIKDFDKAMKDAADMGTVLLLVNNGRYSRYIPVKIPKD